MKLTSTIESGKYLLIDQGEVFVAEKGDSVLIHFVFEKEQMNPFSFFLKVEFNSNEEKKPQFNISTNQENNTIILKLFNFDGAVGAGNVDLIDIATLGGKKCYLRFFSSKVSNEVGNLFKYFIFMEK